MNAFVGIVAVVILLVAYLFIRNRNTDSNRRPDRTAAAADNGNTQFHAVSLRYDNAACQAAKDMAGRRFLSSAAPRVPLPDCDAAACNCVFTHHKDRRVRDDRRSPFGQGFGGAASGNYAAEQRTGKDRRKRSEDDLY